MMPRLPGPPPAAAMRPELELIACFLRPPTSAGSEDHIHSLLQGHLNWDDVMAIATRHKVQPIVWERLSGLDHVAIPAAAKEAFHQAARAAAASSLAQLQELLRLCERFDAERIPAIPYKGPVLSWLAYGSFTRRVYQDLDFVLPQRHIPAATSLMQAAGYEPQFDPREAHAGGRKHAPGQYSFFCGARNVLTELHTERTMRYFPIPPDLEDMHRRLIPVEVAGRTVRTFSIEDTLVLLAVHGGKHFWERLSWILDLAELIRTRSVDWPLAMRMAARAQCRRALLLGLCLAQEVLGATLPDSVREDIARDSNVRGLADIVHGELAGKTDPNAGILPRARFRLLSRDSFAQGIRHMLRLAVSPTETDRGSTHLPGPFYVFARPWRLLREYGLGLRRRTKPGPPIL